MRNLFLVFAFLICLNASAQDTIHSTSNDTAAQQTIIQNQYVTDSLAAIESLKQNTDRSVQNFISYQNEQNAKKKKQAYLYIGFGLAMMIVLIIGLRRRVKK